MRHLLATLLLALPAHAQEPRMSLEPGTGSCFAFVVIENRLGVYIRDETLETERGPVVLHYETIGGHNATDCDLVDVVSRPAGVTAEPVHLELPVWETGRDCLMEWIGG